MAEFTKCSKCKVGRMSQRGGLCYKCFKEVGPEEATARMKAVSRKKSKVPRFLRDMRHVWYRPEHEDRTESQRSLRQSKKDNPARFQGELAKLEAAYLAKFGAEEEKQGPEAAPDHGTERVEELIQRLLDKANQDARS